MRRLGLAEYVRIHAMEDCVDGVADDSEELPPDRSLTEAYADGRFALHAHLRVRSNDPDCDTEEFCAMFQQARPELNGAETLSDVARKV